MRAIRKERAGARFLITLTAILSLFVGAYAQEPARPVNGRIENLGFHKMLRVWGTPEEMGFAHGYLLSEVFGPLLEERMLAMPESQRASYERMRRRFGAVIDFSDDAMAEFRGMIAGIKSATGHLPRIESLDREMVLGDLLMLNASDFLRDLLGCSGFTVWGHKTHDTSLLTARNFDFPVPGVRWIETQLVLLRQPENRKQVATITWPGYIGAVTAFNEDGVCVFLHDGNGPSERMLTGKHMPLAFIMKEVLETSDASNAHARAKDALSKLTMYPYSYMVRVVAPRKKGSDESPVSVFRVDAGGFSQNPARNEICITTNHYLKDDFKPVDNSNDWSLTRYERLQERLSGSITDKKAWEALRAVASDNVRFPTLHTLIVYPERREFEFGLAKWVDRIQPAPLDLPLKIRFDAFFGTSN